MLWRNGLAVCVVVGMGAAAHGSFELMLALDRSDRVVHRYDPETGAYLGNFGAGYIQNPIGMVMDQNTQTAYILQDRAGSQLDYVTRLNYNTGAFLGTLQLSFASARSIGLLNSGQLMASALFGDVSRINAAGAEDAYVSRPSAVSNAGYFSGMAQDSFGTVYALYDNGVIYGWSNPFSTFGQQPSVNFGATTTFQSRGQLSIRGDWLAAGNLNALFFGRTAPGGGFFLTSSTTTIYSNIRGTAIGHNNMMYAAGQTGASLGSVSRYDQFGNFAGSFGSAQLKDPIALSVVVAPEPGTMAALGLGLAAILKRRRKQR